MVLAHPYRDYLFQEGKEKAVAGTLIPYKTEKKEQQIDFQNIQLTEQNVINQRNYLIMGILVIFVVAYYSGHFYKK